MIELPNNRLILNGHRIASIKQFYEYLTRKFKTSVNNTEDLKILKEYKELKIAIRHAGNFLEEETKDNHDKIIKELSKYGEIKQTDSINLLPQKPLKMTKQQKKKAIFFLMSGIIAIIVIIILCQNTRLQKPSNNVGLVLTEIEKQMAACEEKIINDFQLVEPEFVWNSDNDINGNSLKGHVIYQETNSVNTTEFECKVGNNGKDVRINWDRSNNPSSDDIIYDDRE